MAEHPIQGLMNVTMDKIRQMADSNTIIGKPIKTDDGTTILPVSRISFGFASAGTDFDGNFSGGAQGAGEQHPLLLAAGEIGRASCRERV